MNTPVRPWLLILLSGFLAHPSCKSIQTDTTKSTEASAESSAHHQDKDTAPPKELAAALAAYQSEDMETKESAFYLINRYLCDHKNPDEQTITFIRKLVIDGLGHSNPKVNRGAITTWSWDLEKSFINDESLLPKANEAIRRYNESQDSEHFEIKTDESGKRYMVTHCAVG